eukprot:GHVR01040325.1.p1 GENE.GHVR01040325.1~~GHVR01040325.1.p1  ORF type:complete len:150 (-),score=14.54 GHVR01040325.1:11-460(-)
MNSTVLGDINSTVLDSWERTLFDSCACFGDNIQELVFRRRDMIKPDLKPSVRAICSPKVPVGSLLFADDLPKTLKDIKDIYSLRSQVGARPPYQGKGSWKGHNYSGFKQNQNQNQNQNKSNSSGHPRQSSGGKNSGGYGHNYQRREHRQ